MFGRPLMRAARAVDRILAMDRYLHYDAARRRLWVMGQRCHHGATGALVAALGLGGLPMSPRHCAGLVLAGGMLMLHDRKDRLVWFERGPGSQT